MPAAPTPPWLRCSSSSLWPVSRCFRHWRCSSGSPSPSAGDTTEPASQDQEERGDDGEKARCRVHDDPHPCALEAAGWIGEVDHAVDEALGHAPRLMDVVE